MFEEALRNLSPPRNFPNWKTHRDSRLSSLSRAGTSETRRSVYIYIYMCDALQSKGVFMNFKAEEFKCRILSPIARDICSGVGKFFRRRNRVQSQSSLAHKYLAYFRGYFMRLVSRNYNMRYADVERDERETVIYTALTHASARYTYIYIYDVQSAHIEREKSAKRKLGQKHPILYTLYCCRKKKRRTLLCALSLSLYIPIYTSARSSS